MNGIPETAAKAVEQRPVLKNHAAFIWSVADLLRGNYKQSEYGRVILPLTVLRRLDCVLAPTKSKVLEQHDRLKDKVQNLAPVLAAAALPGHEHQQLYNTSKLDLARLLDDPDKIAGNLRAYIAGFSESARDVLEHFDFDPQIDRLAKANLLYQVIGRFAELDLHPDRVSNLEMGYLYEELIRKFSELSNETAGEHFTPREVVRLMVNLLFTEDGDALSKPGVKRTLLDPACGTGGMLSVAEDHLRDLNPQGRLEVYGQELNPETYATCRADMMLKGQNASNIRLGNSFSEDAFAGEQFDYLLANPPFGVEWKNVEQVVKGEAAERGFDGRFGAGLPRINDGSFLFLQHMISKMRPAEQGGSRLAIVFNGSPLFTGAAGSGESEIRRWIIENDWLDAVVALPDQLFYNTGISTYFWIVTNRKAPQRRGTVQLIDGRELFVKMRKSLGEKRKEISDEQIGEITRLYHDHAEGERVKIFPNHAFGFMRITVERPLRVHAEINDETLEALAATKQVAALEPADRDALVTAVGAIEPKRFDHGSKELAAAVEAAVAEVNATAAVRKKLAKAVLSALTVRDADDPIVTKRGGAPEADADLRDQENVPLPDVPLVFEPDVTGRLEEANYRRAVDEYVEAEVLPYVPDAWVDYSKTKVGFEIPLTRHFYKYVPPRPLEEIDAEIRQLEAEIQALLAEVTE